MKRRERTAIARASAHRARTLVDAATALAVVTSHATATMVVSAARMDETTTTTRIRASASAERKHADADRDRARSRPMQPSPENPPHNSCATRAWRGQRRDSWIGCGERSATAASSEDARSGPASDHRRPLLELHRAAEGCLCAIAASDGDRLYAVDAAVSDGCDLLAQQAASGERSAMSSGVHGAASAWRGGGIVAVECSVRVVSVVCRGVACAEAPSRVAARSCERAVTRGAAAAAHQPTSQHPRSAPRSAQRSRPLSPSAPSAAPPLLLLAASALYSAQRWPARCAWRTSSSNRPTKTNSRMCPSIRGRVDRR